MAGVEAVISHLVVEKFGIPCAHAPALLPYPLNPCLCPKSAAEEVRYDTIEEREREREKLINELVYIVLILVYGCFCDR